MITYKHVMLKTKYNDKNISREIKTYKQTMKSKCMFSNIPKV